MNLEINHTGTLRFGDGTTARVIVVGKNTYPATGMPTDYLFSYAEGETNQQLTHKNLPGKFPLPEGLVEMVFTLDEKFRDPFDVKYEKYLNEKFEEKNRAEADSLNRSLIRLMGKEEFAKKYFTDSNH